MGSFTIRPAALLVLLAMLAALTLILVLPQVELQDTAFQRNTSPLAICTRSRSAPPSGAEVSLFHSKLVISPLLRYEPERRSVPAIAAEHLDNLDQSMRC